MKDGFQKPAFRIPTIHDLLMSIDFVPPMYAPPTGISKLVVLEDNDATIKMVIKGRSPAMRHIQRTHRVDLDWLFERFRIDPGLYMRFIGTKDQIADLLTKGSFTGSTWAQLCRLAQVGKSHAAVTEKLSLPPSNSPAVVSILKRSDNFSTPCSNLLEPRNGESEALRAGGRKPLVEPIECASLEEQRMWVTRLKAQRHTHPLEPLGQVLSR